MSAIDKQCHDQCIPQTCSRRQQGDQHKLHASRIHKQADKKGPPEAVSCIIQHQSKGKSQEKISQHDWYGLYDCVTQFFYFTFHFDFKSLSLISLFPTNYFSISFLCRQWSDIGSLVPGKTMRNTLREFLKLSRQSPRSRASTDFGSLLA